MREFGTSIPSSATSLATAMRFVSSSRRSRKVSRPDVRLWIEGENGTGKELVARASRAMSGRNRSPYYAVNCATQAPGLIESELFGHEKGAFPGAVRLKKGRLELAAKERSFSMRSPK